MVYLKLKLEYLLVESLPGLDKLILDFEKDTDSIIKAIKLKYIRNGVNPKVTIDNGTIYLKIDTDDNDYVSEFYELVDWDMVMTLQKSRIKSQLTRRRPPFLLGFN